MSVRQIAMTTGLSATTVSRSLRGDSKVSAATQQRVLLAAQEAGYEHNPLIGRMMSTLRRRDSKTFRGNLAILVKNLKPGLLSDTRLADVVSGARTRAEALRFALDRFDLDASSSVRLESILLTRGVDGVMVFMPSFGGMKVSLQMDFSHFACVAGGWGLWQPEMDTVRVDYHQTIRLILEHVVPTFGNGVAIIWDFATDEAAHRVARGAFLTHYPGGVSRAEKLFLSPASISKSPFSKLVVRLGIGCVVMGSSFDPPPWLAEVIPRERWIWCRDPGDVPSFGWIKYQNRLLGEWGINLLVSKLQMNETGLPKNRQSVLVPSLWNPGQRG